jgi:hypothetical protein
MSNGRHLSASVPTLLLLVQNFIETPCNQHQYQWEAEFEHLSAGTWSVPPRSSSTLRSHASLVVFSLIIEEEVYISLNRTPKI